MIARQFVQKGHFVKVFSQWRDHHNKWLLDSTVLAPRYEGQYTTDGVHVHNLQPRMWQRLVLVPFLPTYFLLPELSIPAISKMFQTKLKSLCEDVDLIHNVRIGREPLSWASYEMAKKKNVPFFITPNYSPRMRSLLGAMVLRKFFQLLRKSDGVFVFTEDEKQEMLNLGVDENKIFVIGLGPLLNENADAEGFKRQYGIKDRMILFLGQKLHYKGYDTLLEAATRVWRDFPETSFVFMGPHHGKSIKLLQAAKNSRVIDIPGVDPFDPLKSSALAASDALVVPSRQEGIGGVYIEAWAHAKPVIGCDIPFVRDVVDNGKDGFLVQQSPADVAEKIVWLLANPAKAAQMGNLGKEKIGTKYNWTTVVGDIANSYERVLSGR
jgi:glycosyltransferase involved in cell wall biosynthesis